MFFEVWTEDSAGKATRKLATTGSWPLANFFARLTSLTGRSMVICDQCFDGEPAGSKTPVATYRLGLLVNLFAGAPGPPSVWP